MFSVHSVFSETAIDVVIIEYENSNANNNRCIGKNEGQFVETNSQVDKGETKRKCPQKR